MAQLLCLVRIEHLGLDFGKRRLEEEIERRAKFEPKPDVASGNNAGDQIGHFADVHIERAVDQAAAERHG